MPTNSQINRDVRTGAWPWLVLLLLAIALMALGCDRKKSAIQPIQKAAPVPSTAATATAIASARTNVVQAQTSVREGRAYAEAGRAAEAVPPLTVADGSLTAALADLSTAKNETAILKVAIEKMASVHGQRSESYDKRIASLEKEIKRLENEVLRKAQLTIGGVGSFLLLAAVGCLVAGIWFGFVPGVRIAVSAGSAGGAAMSVAVMLPKIVLGFEIAAIVAVAALLCWIGYKLWRAHRDTLDHVVAGVQKAKDALRGDNTPAVLALRNYLNDATTEADKKLIAQRKQKVIQP